MIQVIGFQDWHLAALEKRWVYLGDEHIDENFKARARMENCFMLTLAIDNQPIAIFGLTKLWTGVAEIWGLISDRVKERPIEFHKQTLRLISLFAERLELRRIGLEVRADFNMGLKWAAKLGFDQEGRLKNFGADGADYIIFARFF